MAGAMMNFEEADLYQRHIKKILDPFCSISPLPPEGLTYRDL
jgi:hypothetical protein